VCYTLRDKVLCVEKMTMTGLDMKKLETTAYRESFSDGLVDLFAGLALVWIGACWIWLESFAPFATIVPAALAPVVIPIRRRIVESRVGYVRWTAARRATERRQLAGLLAVGVGALTSVVAIAVYRAMGNEVPAVESLVAGLPAALVAMPLVVLAAVSGLWRLWGYSVVLLLTAAATILADAGPGWPLLAGGLAMLASGVVLFARFVTPSGEHEP
jgi:hypothetical protein